MIHSILKLGLGICEANEIKMVLDRFKCLQKPQNRVRYGLDTLQVLPIRCCHGVTP